MVLLELHTHFQMQKYPIPATDEFGTYFHILLFQGNLRTNSQTVKLEHKQPHLLLHYTII
jgi:hypothetical protein